MIRSAKTPFSKDGGLAVLSGNIAPEGCIVKTAGVDDFILVLRVRRGCLNCRMPQLEAILLEQDLKEADVLVIRYEGPKGGPD